MTLQTSGAVSFSQIVAEFGGVGSHSMSEYHALAGLGVSGIPASGAISFSTFYGKSNQVTTSVWVESGHYADVFTHLGTFSVVTGSNAIFWAYVVTYGRAWFVLDSGNSLGLTGANGTVQNLSNAAALTEIYVGTRRYSRGAFHSNPSAGGYIDAYHELVVWDDVNTWVDTSGYQNTTTTVQITT